jgi:hypothetical protein
MSHEAYVIGFICLSPQGLYYKSLPKLKVMKLAVVKSEELAIKICNDYNSGIYDTLPIKQLNEKLSAEVFNKDNKYWIEKLYCQDFLYTDEFEFRECKDDEYESTQIYDSDSKSEAHEYNMVYLEGLPSREAEWSNY